MELIVDTIKLKSGIYKSPRCEYICGILSLLLGILLGLWNWWPIIFNIENLNYRYIRFLVYFFSTPLFVFGLYVVLKPGGKRSRNLRNISRYLDENKEIWNEELDQHGYQINWEIGEKVFGFWLGDRTEPEYRTKRCPAMAVYFSEKDPDMGVIPAALSRMYMPVVRLNQNGIADDYEGLIKTEWKGFW